MKFLYQITVILSFIYYKNYAFGKSCFTIRTSYNRNRVSIPWLLVKKIIQLKSYFNSTINVEWNH